MLSIKKLTNAKGTAHYFEKDNYYSEDSEESKNKSKWLGKGALLAGYIGTVDTGDFEKVLAGNIGEKRLGRQLSSGEWSHTAGWDMTFSAPKSFSIAVELNKDSELYSCHEKAVERVVDYLELSQAQTRINVAGQKTFVPTGNLLAAAFHHNTSRELDPQIHTHVVVANATLHDEKWRALSSEKLFDFKKLTGKIYRECLSEEVEKKGYEISITDRDQHFFEMKGVPREVITHFSQRRALIEKELERLGMSGGKAASIAALGTRKSKQNVDRDSLHSDWNDRAVALGFDPSVISRTLPDRTRKSLDGANSNTESNEIHSPLSIVTDKNDDGFHDFIGVFGDEKKELSKEDKKIVERYLHKQSTPTKEAIEAVEYGVKWISERNASFKESELVAFVNDESGSTESEIIVALNHIKEKGDLIVKSSMLLTTKAAVDLELENIALMKAGQNNFKKAASSYKNVDKEISSHVKKVFKKRGFPSLTTGQIDSLKLVMTTRDRFIGVQGRAGVGKTTMLGVAESILISKKQQPIFLAPTGAATSVLKSELKSQAATVDRWLIDLERDKNNKNLKEKYKNQVWLVDEAGMLSSRQVNRIFDAAKQTNSKVVLVGDSKQLESVEAGRPFSQLIDSDMATAEMKEIRRQKDKNLLDAVYGLLDGNIADALKKVRGNITEHNKANRLKKSVERFFDLGRDETILIIPANKDRHEANGFIRDRLKEEGTLTNNQKGSVLENLDLRQVAKSRASSYGKKDILRFGISNKKLKIERGEYFVIKEISVENNTLIIESLKDKKEVNLKLDYMGKENIKSGIEAYRVVTYEMAEGDEFRWKRSDKENNIINGQKFKISKIRKGEIDIINEDGSKKTINRTDVKFKHIDYAYSDTVYSAQGQTAKNSVLVLESYRKNLINQKSTYVGLSRASHHAEIITDDKTALSGAIEGRSGENTTALNTYKKEINKERDNELELSKKRERKIDKEFNAFGI